jgi:hypothetical protein
VYRLPNSLLASNWVACEAVQAGLALKEPIRVDQWLSELEASFGLVPMISSIWVIKSGVNFSVAAEAWRFSSNCATFEAPRMTVLTCGFLRHQATASTDCSFRVPDGHPSEAHHCIFQSAGRWPKETRSSSPGRFVDRDAHIRLRRGRAGGDCSRAAPW